MKVGCIGLGGIAQKAYLPVLGVQPGVELHLQTRTPATLARVGDSLRLSPEQRHTDLSDLLAQNLDAAFVHAATVAHPEIVTRLLEAGVPTFVDKPLAYELADSERLVRLAEERNVSLAVGFNRRHAPGYTQCADHPRDLILMQKNRIGLPEDVRTMVLDDFIHVVDTLRFLAPGPIDDVSVRARVEDGLVHHVVLQLAGDGFTALGVMNRLSGSAEEILEVSGQDTKRQVVNLAEVIDHKGQPSVRRRGDWVPVARQRGIEQSVLAFLDAVRAGKVLSARDALATHELCERVVRAVQERSAGA
ncbi:Gfo/Idh/MocA family oxidoreductase [Streptomyces mirabilis]|uniref:Gfo/Idh/MocA family protein n=1 Tax=Streptomyces TaxID=1883 RepID=UPI0011651349|nr:MULTISPECIES: Gfo/Idh/MocA family oxidoreductase [Streptomyces]MCX4607190.1 Gfo/Idh/MocA family oxidoreductase [Streptomyces mirabilis]MCX5347652.1 Gfo/Idh/MocA family oxidoreductase [Streptomyces mirabilis]QDN86316.1 Gfo/Idh/MocA family oxidoreductase [Streptomyces sp. RLB3-6]QDO07129.1 Gfo/Idh/MocA family oxidoreductase [Streptomyces sp. S1D4-23]